MSTWRIVVGDALERLRELEDGSVQTCVTSPPYFGLRDYGTADWDGGDPACDHQQGRPGAGRADGVVDDRAQRNRDGVGSMGGDCKRCGATRTDSQLGLEATPDEYVARLVEVFREVRRVLRDDGTLWLNLGDSYAQAKGHGHWESRDGKGDEQGQKVTQRWRDTDASDFGVKPKDLLGIPWMVAFALRADGWYLRSDIVWAKPNPMPESVTDRPTKAHEYVFLLSKSPKYFWDAEAVREGLADANAQRTTAHYDTAERYGADNGGNGGLDDLAARMRSGEHGGRNIRSVWTVATAPFAGCHFAVFPPKLIEPCVLAGSAEDACGVCGAPWERVVERVVPVDPGRGDESKLRDADGLSARAASTAQRQLGGNYQKQLDENPPHTVGFESSCDHQDKTASSTVLDPFAGAGTTGLVATRLGRSFIGIELNPEYAEMARERIRDDAPLMNYLIEEDV